MTTTTTPRQASPTGAIRNKLHWRGRRVKDRIIFTVDDLTRVVRVLAGGGAHDLRLYLWLVASAQWIEHTATVLQTYRQLATAVDMCVPETSSALTSAMHKVLRRLEAVGLIETERVRGKHVVIRLLDAAGCGEPHVIPDPKGRGVGKVFIDGTFFANGWHAVLSKHALAFLLAGLVEETRQYRTRGLAENKARKIGVFRLSRDEMEHSYRIHHDALNAGKKELASFGLLRYEYDELNDEQRWFEHVPPHTYSIYKQVWGLVPAEAPRYEVVTRRETVVDKRTRTFMRLQQPRFRPVKSRGSKVVPLDTEGKA